MKYRIYYDANNKFEPKLKYFLFWFSLGKYDTLEAAEQAIKSARRSTNKSWKVILREGNA